PEGITYDVENEAFRTEKVNGLFALNASLNSLSEDDINEQGGIKATLSRLVGRTGFEPATPWSQTRYSTGLNYLPNLKCPRSKRGCKTMALNRSRQNNS